MDAPGHPACGRALGFLLDRLFAEKLYPRIGLSRSLTFKENVMMEAVPLAKLWGITWLWWWQVPLFLLVAVLVVFWVMYRRRQM